MTWRVVTAAVTSAAFVAATAWLRSVGVELWPALLLAAIAVCAVGLAVCLVTLMWTGARVLAEDAERRREGL